MVWRIFHFEERFELPENIRKCRKTALEFTRDFVGDLGGDEAVGYQRQFALLTNGDGLEHAQMYGLYRLLVNMSAKQSKAYRGYLLDARKRPLSVSQIAKLLHIHPATMKKYLRRLESVDLLEYVDLPEFDLSKNDDDKEQQKDSGRRAAENSARRRKPLKNGKTAKPPNGGKRVKEQRATNGLTAVKEKININGNRQIKDSGQGQRKDEPPSAPSTAPPLPSMPHRSDAQEGSRVIPITSGPPGSVIPPNGRQGDHRPMLAGGYDRSDDWFGQRIYVALGYRGDVSSPEARREICSFASKWAQCRMRLSGMDPPALDQLGMRVLAEARKISRRGKKNSRPGAVMNTVMDRLTDATVKRAM